MNKNKQNAVYLKKIQSDDFDFYKSIYTNKDLMQYVGPLMTDEKITRCFNKSVRETQQSTKNQRLYVIRQRSDEDYVGLIGLNWSQENMDSAEIGTIITNNHHRKGYAYISLYTLITYASLHLSVSTFVGILFSNNKISDKLVKKVGFRKINKFINNKNNVPSIRWEITQEDLNNE